MKNVMELKVKSLPENMGFVRDAVAAFTLPLDPSLSELSDIKTAVSEAVTNCVVHAYPGRVGYISVRVSIDSATKLVNISVSDTGVGICDIKKAIQPFYTTRPSEERSGMGFTIMESFMDNIDIKSENGVTVSMSKKLGAEAS